MAASDSSQEVSPKEVVCKSFEIWSPQCYDLLKTCQQTPSRQIVLCKLLDGEENYRSNNQCEVDNSSINMETSSLQLDVFLRSVLNNRRMALIREEEDEDLYN